MWDWLKLFNNQVSKDYARAAELILKIIETISNNLPRLEIYLRLQPDPHLDVSLLLVFTDVVEFSVRAFQYFGQHSASESRLLYAI